MAGAVVKCALGVLSFLQFIGCASYKHIATIDGGDIGTKGHRAAISGLGFSPDGRMCVSSDLEGAVKVWSTETGRLLKEFPLPLEPRSAQAAFLPDGRGLLISWADVEGEHSPGKIELWDPASWTRKEAATLEHSEITVSPDGQCLLLRSHTEGPPQVLPSQWGFKAILRFWYPRPCEFSPNSKYVLVTSAGPDVQCIESKTGREVAHRELGFDHGTIVPLTGGLFLVLGHVDVFDRSNGTMAVWDMGSSETLRTLGRHDTTVRSAQLNAHGDVLASVDDRELKVWSWPAGSCLQVLPVIKPPK